MVGQLCQVCGLIRTKRALTGFWNRTLTLLFLSLEPSNSRPHSTASHSLPSSLTSTLKVLTHWWCLRRPWMTTPAMLCTSPLSICIHSVRVREPAHQPSFELRRPSLQKCEGWLLEYLILFLKGVMTVWRSHGLPLGGSTQPHRAMTFFCGRALPQMWMRLTQPADSSLPSSLKKSMPSSDSLYPSSYATFLAAQG